MPLGSTVVVDADVLVPVVSCDFLLTAFDYGLIEPVVSSATLDEVERTLIQDFPHLDLEALRRRVAAMRHVLDDHIIDIASAAAVPAGINAKDRHVVACAIEAEAALVVTNDRALRTEITTARIGIAAVDGDKLALELCEAAPEAVRAVIEALAAKRRHPPVTVAEMADQLQVLFPSTIARLYPGRSPG